MNTGKPVTWGDFWPRVTGDKTGVYVGISMENMQLMYTVFSFCMCFCSTCVSTLHFEQDEYHKAIFSQLKKKKTFLDKKIRELVKISEHSHTVSQGM